ncbi:unnamed protein product [Rangifer tarandus platyrhynchus]|uniref:Uncharacterized protein n=1 Tax=Rangifer tarandus platyrhynchus TaxID=3082113 RepID=A0AC59ZNT8_RANTA
MTILRSSGPVPVASPATVLLPQAAPPRCPLQHNDAAARTALRLPAGTHSHWSAPRRPGDAPPGDALPTPPPGPQRAWDVAFLVARRRLGVTQEGLTWRRVFCSPNASRDSEPELTLQDQLRELQQRREEEERRRQRRGEERRLQKLRAGQQALPDRVPTLLSAGAPPARPAPSGKPVSLVYSCGFQLSSCFVGQGGYYISEAHGSCEGNFIPSTFQKGTNVAFLMFGAYLVAQTVKKLPAVWETWVHPWVRKIPWRRN